MNKLIVLSGVPGSGKSYFSNTIKKVIGSHVYIISSDQLRTLISGNQQDLSKEDLVWDIFYSLAEVYSKDKEGIVILDATHFSTIKRIENTKRLRGLFAETDLVLFDVDKSVVSNQNFQREYPIPPEVLDRFFEIFEMPSKEDKDYFDRIIIIKNNDITKAVEIVKGNEPIISLLGE